jgi:2-amino-4-hydroxy-6-hydroxymethyldihydropteridine diphosphokinase
MSATQVYLSLGANMGDRAGNLRRAVAQLTEQGLTLTRESSLYETEPQELQQQPWFVNIAVECSTTLLPLEVLAVIHRIERELGRDRTAAVPKGPRLIDIDILLYGRAVIRSPELVVPHPRMMERRFVLEPLLEIAPELRHPVSGALLKEQLTKIHGQVVRRLDLTQP